MIHPSDISFEDAKNTLAYATMVAATGVAGFSGADILAARNRKPTLEGLSGVDVELIEQAAEQTDDIRKARFKAYAPVLAGAASLGLFGVHMLNPHTTEEVAVANTEAMYVIDASHSMQYTKDMEGSQTRFSSVLQAISDATSLSPADMRIGAVLYGENNVQVAPLTTDRKLLAEGLQTAIPGNGNDANGALTTAINSLGNTAENATQSLFYFTDGTIDTPEQVSQQLAEIAEGGTEVVVVLTGTEGGSYTRTAYDPQATASGVQRAFVQNIQNNNNVQVLESTVPQDMTKLLQETTKKQTTKQEKTPTRVFLYAAAAFAVASVVQGAAHVRRGTRTIVGR